MGLKRYDVVVEGHATTLQLSDEHAKELGLTAKDESKEAKAAPAAKAAKAPANKQSPAPQNKAADAEASKD